jgi:hypothetical protein
MSNTRKLRDKKTRRCPMCRSAHIRVTTYPKENKILYVCMACRFPFREERS